MAPINKQKSNLSSNYGEDIVQRVNVLASCYIVDSTSGLKGIHYCTTGATGMPSEPSIELLCQLSPPRDSLMLTLPQGPSGIPEVPSSGLPSPPTSPPLAALTSSNELALLPKRKSEIPGRRLGRRGGAAHSIREECERFFCGSMKTVFLGERSPSTNGSSRSGAFLPTPPPDNQFPDPYRRGSEVDVKRSGFEAESWMEVWDYAGGASFRAFVANNGRERSLFVFFDVQGMLGRDLKKALMALIELSDGPLDCSHIVTCIDRRMSAGDAIELTKSLQWVGFEMTTLDHWADDLDVTSDKWLFMGMEV